MPPVGKVEMTPRQEAIFNALYKYYLDNIKVLGVGSIDADDMRKAVVAADTTGQIELNAQGQISGKTIKNVWQSYSTIGSASTPGGTPSTIPPWPGDDGGGGGGTKPNPSAKPNAQASFESLVSMYGLDSSGNIGNLISLAVQQGWNSARFINQLRDTPEYQQRFTGIFDENGNPKMSEAAYIAQEKRYEDIAKTTGLNIGPGRLGFLFANDVSPSEFAQRAQALVRVQNNPDLFKQFAATLNREGLAKNFTRKDAFSFVMGEAPKEWYNVWNQAASRYQATQAGINLGQKDSYTTLNPQTAEKIGRKGFSEAELASGYKNLAQSLTSTIPLSRVSKFGITKQDLVQLEFGGPRQAAVAERVRQLMENEKSFIENRTTQATTNLGKRGSTPRA